MALHLCAGWLGLARAAPSSCLCSAWSRPGCISDTQNLAALGCRTCPDLFSAGCVVPGCESPVWLLALKQGFHCFFPLKARNKRKHTPLGLQVTRGVTDNLEQDSSSITDLLLGSILVAFCIEASRFVVFVFSPSFLESKAFRSLEAKCLRPRPPLDTGFFLQFVFTLTVFDTYTPCHSRPPPFLTSYQLIQSLFQLCLERSCVHTPLVSLRRTIMAQEPCALQPPLYPSVLALY